MEGFGFGGESLDFYCFVLSGLGGGCCCVLGFRVCFLCLLCSFCWEEDASVHCDGHLHSPGKLNLSEIKSAFNQP